MVIQNTNCISILLYEPFQIPSHLVKPSQIFSFFDWCTEELLCRSPLFKTLNQGWVDVLFCLVQVQYEVCPQRRVPCARHGKQLIIAVSWGYLVRGDTGKCSCSHRVCERSTHAQSADKKVRKGTEKNPGILELSGPAKQRWVGVDLKGPKVRCRNSGCLYRLLSAVMVIGEGQNRICSRQFLAVQ